MPVTRRETIDIDIDKVTRGTVWPSGTVSIFNGNQGMMSLTLRDLRALRELIDLMESELESRGRNA